MGEKIHAAVVLRPGESSVEKEMIDFCRRTLPGFKCPKAVHFVGALARNPSGKVLEHVLKKDFEG